MNLFKVTWMRLNSTRFIDLKMKLNFDKIRMLRLCSNFSLIINYWKNLEYCIINIKVDKACRAIDDIIKKIILWIEFDWSFFETVRNLILYWRFWKRTRTRQYYLYRIFSEMLICVKRVSRYFIVFLMFINSQSKVFSRKLFSV